jgi:peptide/nickel transport system ATP-binding protein
MEHGSLAPRPNTDLRSRGTAISTTTLLQLERLRVHFGEADDSTALVDGASLQVRPGETLGLVGESGSGKTLTALSILRLQQRSAHVSGQILFNGRGILQLTEAELERLRGNRIAMIFQDPMTAFDPIFRIGDQISEAIVRHQGLSRAAARARALGLLERVQMPDAAQRMEQIPDELSGGMRQRAMIAMALACSPQLLIADEPTTALDVTIQAQILGLLKRLQRETGLAILLITHDLGVAAQLADRVVVMYAGRIAEEGSAELLFERPAHPYTAALLRSAVPADSPRGARLAAIGGAIPRADEMPTGCRFQLRCPNASARCVEQPPLIDDGLRRLACFHPLEQEGAAWVAEAHAPAQPPAAAEAGAWRDPQPSAAGESARWRNPQPSAAGASARWRDAPPLTPSPTEPSPALRAARSPAASSLLMAAGAHALIEVRELSKHFDVRRGWLGRPQRVTAIDRVSFAIEAGETFGLVGESGCGKSTLGRVLLQLERPSAGEIWFEGRPLDEHRGAERKRLRRDMQMIFQDPYGSIDPRWKVADVIAEPLRAHERLAPAALRARVDELLALVGLPSRARDRHAHEFSGGQRQRIGIARAIATNPKFIVADEALSALDLSVQAQIINLLIDLRERLQLTSLFIGHGLHVVRHLSDRIGVMYLGRLVEVADADALFQGPAHHYTHALIASIPSARPGRQTELAPPLGELPSPSAPPPGCHFHPRCPAATERCRREAPSLQLIDPGRLVACHHPRG